MKRSIIAIVSTTRDTISKKFIGVFLLLSICGMVSVNAGVIIDTGTPVSGGQANLLADAGQSFTTGTLGADNRLASISIYTSYGTAAFNPTGPFVLEVYTDTDGNYTTWDPGTLVGVSDSQSLPTTSPPMLVTFTFNSLPLLSDNTVYLFTYTDGFGTRVAARMGLTNDGDALSNGYLFHQGGAPDFGGAYDTAMQIATDSPPALDVTPTTILVSAGNEGGPFTSSNIVYTLENLGTSGSIDWSAISNQTWVSASPASGTLAPSETVDVIVSINSAATSLPVGFYSASMVFSNQLSGNIWPRGIFLEITRENDEIIVNTILDPMTPSADRAYLNAQAGQTFTTATLTRNQLSTIAIQAPIDNLNTNSFYIAVYNDADQNSATWDPGTLVGVSTSSQSFLAVNAVQTWTFGYEVLSNNTVYAYMPTSDPKGTMAVDTRVGFERHQYSGGEVFSEGLPFSFGSGWDIATRIATISYEELYVTPATPFVSSGLEGGPFTPSNTVYTLKNFSTSNSVDWVASSNEIWVGASPASGTLAPLATVDVTVSINSHATALYPGLYSASVVFSNELSGLTLTRDISLTVVHPFSYQINGDTVTITGYTGAGGAVVIPSTIEGKDVTVIGDYAFGSNTNLTGITIPDSVTSIGDEAFAVCTSLTSVTIPDSVISLGNYVFYDCTGLTNVTIGNSVTTIGDETFAACTSLTSITIPDSVTSIGWEAFSDCISLASVTIGNSVTTIGYAAFASCTSLTSITIPASVTSIGLYAFEHCDGLTAITVDVGNTVYSSVDGVLFNKDQTSLIQYPGGGSGSYTIPDSVTSIIDYAFAYCTNLTSITIPDSVNSIGSGAFGYCRSLTSVTIPDSVTSIEAFVFRSCSSLVSITIPDSVTSIENAAFRGCTSLGSIAIPDSVTSIGYQTFYYCTGLTSVTIGGGVTSIENYAFGFCTSLVGITIPDSVTYIGSYVFEDCTILNGVYFKGNAPSAGSNVFSGADQTTIYYLGETTGWGPTFAGRPTVLWNPLIQTDDGNFGVQAGEFGFNITESESGLVVVKACTNLIDGIWEPIQTNTMTSGSVYFSDPDWVNHPTRFYRLNMP